MLFAFDVERNAILLVGGDKSEDWSGWYQANTPVADERLDEHQKRLRDKQTKTTMRAKSARSKGKGHR